MALCNGRFVLMFVLLGIALVSCKKKSISILDDKFLSKGSTFQAGASKVDATLPLGTPLAGFNHAQRRVPYWPIPQFGTYTTFMMPSTGVLDPTWTKALVIDNGEEQIAFITLDGIGSDGALSMMAWTIAVNSGFKVPFDNCLFSSSHTHSGPGAIASDMLWSLAPATDLIVPSLARQLATSMAQAMVEAFNNMEPAMMDIGMGNLVGVTTNRRAGFSKYVRPGTIDPHLGVIRVDTAGGDPIATVWNFAIHGTCYGPSNMNFSSDIMGVACKEIEQAVGGVALFINGDAGDIDPAPTMCNRAPAFKGSALMAAAVKEVHDSLKPTSQNIQIRASSIYIDFGPTDLNATLGRFSNCTHGGPLDICTFCSWFDCDLNVHMYSSWIQNYPKFTAFSFVINGISTVTTSMPGEALVELGWWIRNDTLAMGYNITFLTGYSNNHMGYFATPNEYDIGGYESQLTLWGIGTAGMVRSGAKEAAKSVIPLKKRK